jgi:hypothetical protein
VYRRRIKRTVAAVAAFLGMPVIDDINKDGGLARGALALTTAIANEVRKGAISLLKARTVFKTARWLVHDRDSLAENAGTAEAADSFLKISEAVVRHKSIRAGKVRPFACGLSLLPTKARRALRQGLEGSVFAFPGLPSEGTTKRTNFRNLGDEQ